MTMENKDTIKSKSIPNSNNAFTLVELIIYTALVALTAIVIISFAWHIIASETKNELLQEVEQNLRFGLEKITRAIREADDASISDSIFDVSPGKLTLIYPGKEIIFDIAAETIEVGGQNVEIHKLRIKDGSEAFKELTSNKVDVTNFVLSNLTQGSEPKNIKIQLTIKHVNPGQDSKWETEIIGETSSSIRTSP